MDMDDLLARSNLSTTNSTSLLHTRRSPKPHTRPTSTSRSQTRGAEREGSQYQSQYQSHGRTTPNSTHSTPRSAHPALVTRTLSAPQRSARPPPPVTDIVEEDAQPYTDRDSIASIKDDPFFRNYQSPDTVLLTRELRSATYLDALHGADEEDERDIVITPPPRSTRRPSTQISGPTSPSFSSAGMAEINIAVIGSSGAGKTTLIQRAFGLRTIPTTIVSSQRMPVDNVLYTVTLVELDLESLNVVSDQRVQWPKQISGQFIPRIDGAMLLYDVMNRDSIVELPQTLNALVSSSLPTILVSCKCDNPENTRQIDVESMESACLSCVEAFKTAANAPESARRCLSSILKAVMANKSGQPGPLSDGPGPRRRAISSAHLEKPIDLVSRPLSQQSKHSRASSEFSLLKGFPTPPLPSPRGQGPSSRHQPNSRTNLHHQFTLPDPHDAPPLSSHPAFKQDAFQGSIDSGAGPDFPEGAGPPMPSPSIGRSLDNSFLDTEGSDTDPSYRYSDDVPILQRSEESLSDKPAKILGVTFDELVDRLLDQSMSRADANFSDIFLCLYRKFASPGELFAAILNRLDKIAEDKNIHYLTRTATQLRIITVVAKWVSSYPGDFASPTTSRRLESFIRHLSADPVFAAAAQEMRVQLHSRVVVDDDTDWARTDADADSEAVSTAESGPPSPVGHRTNSATGVEDGIATLALDDEDSGRGEHKESGAEPAHSPRSASPTHSLAPSFYTAEDYEKEAAMMIPRQTLPLTKFRYHILMDTPDDDIADEMTRIDWVMFSSIRLRDLVRHVSLSLALKEKSKNLANVNRMINHFNHIAKWVANMILMRDKAKHRALMLEKFMTIALKLRQLNNYNSLAAVLAGINGSAIWRLNQTRTLVPAEVHKRFYRLVMLMSPQKSHFSYRLAWENSSLPRIPFIPLTRRDLVSAEEGSRTFVGDNGERINWKKFEILSEVILPIMKSQVVPYPNLQQHETARELILDCKMPTDDEEIYQRSIQVEGLAGTVESGKKKFPWFKA
ncbi:RasGEF domain-containing protein [Phlyctema vagabunda]|uniref:RasGEF domain-containing protein n=1 Tax=Phlyctema vagabunda TaxID=108571 RepID=A0ABR4P390_9HELO